MAGNKFDTAYPKITVGTFTITIQTTHGETKMEGNAIQAVNFINQYRNDV